MQTQIEPTEIPGLSNLIVRDDQGAVIEEYRDLTQRQIASKLSSPQMAQDVLIRQVAASLIR